MRIQKNPEKMIFQFLNYKDETNILKNAKKLKYKSVFINEDFSHKVMEFERCYGKIKTKKINKKTQR